MEKVEENGGDFVLILIVALLVGVGVALLFSASYFQAERLGKEPTYFFKEQLMFIGLGILMAFIAAQTPLDLIRKAVPLIMLVALILTLLSFMPGIGKPIFNSRRWIFMFGYTFQPSELIKLALVIYLAHIFSKKKEKLGEPVSGILPPLIVVLFFTILIYLQNDFSTTFFVFFISLSLFFIAGVKLIYFFLFAAVTIPLGVVLLFTKEYWVKKIMVFLNIDADPAGTGYQVLQARSALISGGLTGKGLGNGVKKLGGLPEAHSDFIFAVIGEEMGLLGVLFILALFVVFAYRGYMICFKSDSDFKSYLAFGITSALFFQVLLNVAVVTGLIPATGMTLPFFSKGGSSILISLIMCGLLFNISRKEKYYWRGAGV